MRLDTSIETYTGLYLDYSNPQPTQIDVNDIARALSHSCRWGGHCSRYYSVAEHAVRVRDAVVQAGHPELALAALHHDSHEAYVGDWPTPLKRYFQFSGYRDLVDKLDTAIADACGFDRDDLAAPQLRAADELLMWREARSLKVSLGHGPHWGEHPLALALDEPFGWSSGRAHARFIEAHHDEMGKLYG